MTKVLKEIRRERERAMMKHNTEVFDMENTKNDWVSYISAYNGRAADKCFRNYTEGEVFRENMVKVAALAVAAIEAYDKGYTE